MKRLLTLAFLACAFSVHAQDTLSYVNQGTIKIVRPKIQPYITIRYNYNMMDEVKKKGQKELGSTPVRMIDTTGRYRVQLPHVRMSDFFVRKLDYTFAVKDTPKIDSMRTVLMVTRAGKLKKVILTERAGDPDKVLEDKFVSLMSGYTEWDKDYKIFEPGGLVRRKNILFKEKFYPRDFNIEATVIFASYPQTEDQWKTGRRYDIKE